MLRLRRWELGNGRLRAYDQLKRRHKLRQHLAVWPHHLQQQLAPALQPYVALGEELARQPLKRLGQGEIGDVALILVELASDKAAARLGDRLVQLVYEHGLPNAGGAGDQDELGVAGCTAGPSNAPERVEKAGELAVAAVELLGDREAAGGVVLGERERCHPPVAGELLLARFEVGDDADGALVAILGGLIHQAQDDGGEHRGDASIEGMGRLWLNRQVVMQELERVLEGEGQSPGEELVQRDAERVIVRAVVEGAVHPPGLLGGHVGEGALEGGRIFWEGQLLGEVRGDPEVNQLELPGGGVVDNIRGVDILVDDLAVVERAEGGRNGDGEGKQLLLWEQLAC